MKIRRLAVIVAIILALVTGAFAPAVAAAKTTTRKRAKIVRRVVKKRTVVKKKSRRRVKRKVVKKAAAAPVAASNTIADAQAILNGLVARHGELQSAPVTVEFGNAMGYQAISYFTVGRIIISPTHTASLDTILRHEVGHIVDYRDNGTIDWGENIPAM